MEKENRNLQPLIMNLDNVDALIERAEKIIDGKYGKFTEEQLSNWRAIIQLAQAYSVNCFAYTLREYGDMVSLNTKLLPKDALNTAAKLLNINLIETGDTLQLDIPFDNVIPEEKRLTAVEKEIIHEVANTNSEDVGTKLVKTTSGDALTIPDIRNVSSPEEIKNCVRVMVTSSDHPAAALKAIDLYRNGCIYAMKNDENVVKLDENTKAAMKDQYMKMENTFIFDTICDLVSTKTPSIDCLIKTISTKFFNNLTPIESHCYVKRIVPKWSDEEVAKFCIHILIKYLKYTQPAIETKPNLFRSEVETLFAGENKLFEEKVANIETLQFRNLLLSIPTYRNNIILSEFVKNEAGKMYKNRFVDRSKYMTEAQRIVNLYNGENKLECFVDKSDYAKAGEYPLSPENIEQKPDASEEQNKAPKSKENVAVEQTITEEKKVPENEEKQPETVDKQPKAEQSDKKANSTKEKGKEKENKTNKNKKK